MTLKESLELCLEMWTWLAENPQARKREFLLAHPEYPNLFNQCACCHYAGLTYDSKDVRCTNCPLYGQWGELADLCHEAGSFWVGWCDAQADKDLVAVKYNALGIVNLCKENLARLNNKE